MIIFRRFAQTDLAALAHLSVAIETADENISRPPDEIRDNQAQALPDLTRTGWLAQVEDSSLIGYNYGEVVSGPKEVNFWLRGGVHPTWRGQSVGRELLRRTWTDLERLRAGFGSQPAWVNAWAYQHDQARCHLFGRFGLRPDHIYHELVLPADQIPPPAGLPAGFIIRPWDESDCAAAAALRNRAFAHSWGYQPTTSEALRRRFQTGRYEPTLSLTAWQAGQMVGLIHACLGGTRRQRREGEIVWVAVEESLRGRGFGRELMLRAMHALRQAGAELIALSTDNYAGRVNLGLFTGLGFTIRQAVVDFRREIVSK